MNIFKTILKLTEQTTLKVTACVTFLATTIILSNFPQAQAAPQGNFGIVTNNGNRVDVYGDNLPSFKGPVHLWKAQYSSNIFKLGTNQRTGNEIQAAFGTTYRNFEQMESETSRKGNQFID